MDPVSFGAGNGRGWRVRDPNVVAGITKELERLFSTSQFIGPHPVSITRDHLSELPHMWVSEKTDGTRALVFFVRVDGRAMCVVRDRNDQWTLLACKAPKTFYSGTLLDGELVSEWTDDGRRAVIYVFDAYAKDGNVVRNEPFETRLRTYRDACAQVRSDACAFEAKPMVRDIRHVPHHDRWNTDGFVWISSAGDSVYKWKPNHTVDFRVERQGGAFVPFLFSKHQMVRADRVVIVDRIGFLSDVWNGDALIVECDHDEGDRWVVSGIRTDKSTPNSCAVFQKTVQSIRAGITFEDLFRLYGSGT